MMEKTNKKWLSMSNGAIVEAIGKYVRHHRMRQNKTQAKVATAAGVNRWTLSQLENGEAVTLLSLIQIMRALNLLHVFEAFEVETTLSPLQLAKLEHDQRKRASGGSGESDSISDW